VNNTFMTQHRTPHITHTLVFGKVSHGQYLARTGVIILDLVHEFLQHAGEVGVTLRYAKEHRAIWGMYATASRCRIMRQVSLYSHSCLLQTVKGLRFYF
jgi:hypothetical protein